MVQKLSIFFLVFFFFGAPLHAEIKISQKPVPPKKELITQQPIITPINQIPASRIHRSLILPKNLIEGDAILEYRNLPSGTGFNLLTQAKKTYFDKWMISAALSAFPQSNQGFQFGGILPGFLYEALQEDAKNPEVAAGLQVGLFGKGPLSLTKDNTFSVFPQVHLKKRVSEHLALLGSLKAGIGNQNSGLAALNATGLWRLTQEFDAHLRLDLENLGYDIESIFSLTPILEYHTKRDMDVIGGVDVGLSGADLLGNNLFAGITKRF